MTNDSLRESRGAEEDRPNELERAIGEYLDRLNAGGRVDRWEILAEHPGIGQEILDGLQNFISLDSLPPAVSGHVRTSKVHGPVVVLSLFRQ